MAALAYLETGRHCSYSAYSNSHLPLPCRARCQYVAAIIHSSFARGSLRFAPSTVRQLLFGFGEAILEMVRDVTSDSDAAQSSPSAAAGRQEPTPVGIEDDTTRAMIARLDRFQWKVDVKVEKGRQLQTADRSWMGVCSPSDPYVKIQLGSQMHKTKLVAKTLNPVWNQCYELELGEGYGAGLTDKVRLTV